MSDDPFATDSTPATDLNRVRVTLKGGSGYDAPWITIDGGDANDALSQLRHVSVPDLLQQTAKVATAFHETYKPKTAATAETPAPRTQPPARNNNPSGDGRLCPGHHTEMGYAENKDPNGRWKARYYCKGTADKDLQCKTVWIN